MLIHLVASVFRALATYGPELWWKVAVTTLGVFLIVLSGFCLSRLLRPIFAGRRRADSRSALDTLLMSYIWGAFYSLFLMYALGGAGIYSAPFLWVALVAPFVVLRRSDLRAHDFRSVDWKKVAPFLIVGLGPLLIALTCPVPSWNDVLELNVAPAQRLLTFGVFERAHALPSALYTVDRATPLFTAFHAMVAGLFGLDAYQELAAVIVPSLVFTLLAAYRLGRVLCPRHQLSGVFAVLSWLLAYSYVHLQDSRSTVWQVVFGLIAITKAVELFDTPGNARLLIECAVAAGAAILAHPLEGFFTAITVLILVVFSLAKDSFSWNRNYLLAAAMGAGVSAPLLWTWRPESAAGLFAGLGLIVLLPLISRAAFASDSRETQQLSQSKESRLASLRILGLVPVAVLIVAALVHWNFYSFGDKSFLFHQLVRYPVPTGLSIALVLLYTGRVSTAALLVGAATLAAVLPLMILPFVGLSPVQSASFSYEFPLKGMDFFLSGVLCVCSSAVMTLLWFERKGIVPKILVIAMLTLPTARLLSLHQDIEHEAAGAYAMLRWQLHVAGDGYWRGYGDPKRLASESDRELFARLRQLVRENRVRYSDRISHVATATNLAATPFPAFTGIDQELYVPKVDSTNIHTSKGRIHDLSLRRPQSGWILIEKSLLQTFPVERSDVIYENDRVILTYRSPRK